MEISGEPYNMFEKTVEIYKASGSKSHAVWTPILYLSENTNIFNWMGF